MTLYAEGFDQGQLQDAFIQLKPSIATILVLLLQSEMEKVRLQFRRIREDTARLHSDMRKKTQLVRCKETDTLSSPDFPKRLQELRQAQHYNQLCLFADVHFLLICLDKIEKLFTMLRKTLPNEPELAVVFSRYSKALKAYSDFRNCLEHIDREVVMKQTADLGNLGGDEFTFGGKTFVIGQTREKEVEGLFKDILEACTEISNRQYEQTNSHELD